VTAVTLAPPPDKYGVTHWSTRLLARHLKISDHSVATAWREAGVQPWRSESFRFSTHQPLLPGGQVWMENPLPWLSIEVDPDALPDMADEAAMEASYVLS